MSITYREYLKTLPEERQRRIKRGVQRLNAKYKKLNAQHAADRASRPAGGLHSGGGESPSVPVAISAKAK